MKRKELFVSVLAVIFAFVAESNAQVHYIVEGGYALTANYSPSPSLRAPMHGAQAAFMVDYRFQSQPLLGIQAGLGYRFAYSVTDYEGQRPLNYPNTYYGVMYHYEVMDHAILLPVRLSINFDVNDWTFKLLTGPKFSYHFGKSQYYAEAISGTGQGWGKADLGMNYIPFDCSWGVGLGVEYKHLYMEVMFDMGLFNRVRRNSETYNTNTYSSRDFTFMVGYRF